MRTKKDGNSHGIARTLQVTKTEVADMTQYLFSVIKKEIESC
jgi:hypothetical protein